MRPRADDDGEPTDIDNGRVFASVVVRHAPFSIQSVVATSTHITLHLDEAGRDLERPGFGPRTQAEKEAVSLKEEEGTQTKGGTEGLTMCKVKARAVDAPFARRSGDQEGRQLDIAGWLEEGDGADPGRRRRVTPDHEGCGLVVGRFAQGSDDGLGERRRR